MKKTINREHIEGRIYDHNLEIKVTGANSKVPNTTYIRGKIDVATDEDCCNVISVTFTYVTEKTSKGGNNNTFTALKNIIENGKTILNNGKDEATMVSIDTALALNDFISERAITAENPKGFVSAKENNGGFLRIVSKLDQNESKRNVFEVDMLINGVRLIEADETRDIPNDYLIVKGAVFNFKNDILPVEFSVRSKEGISYFESLEASPSNMIFTKVWGSITSETKINTKEEQSAFGDAVVTTYEKKVKDWQITGAATYPYEIGDAEHGITVEEIQKALADREVLKAKKEQDYEAYQAQKSVSAGPSNAGVSAAAGGFIF